MPVSLMWKLVNQERLTCEEMCSVIQYYKTLEAELETLRRFRGCRYESESKCLGETLLRLRGLIENTGES